jgi:hypothetical protein
MSRLMADQESRGGNPDAGEEDSIMRVNLAEGGGTVNDKTYELLKRCSFHPLVSRLPGRPLYPATRLFSCRSSSARQARGLSHDCECLAFLNSLAGLMRLSDWVRRVVLIGCYSV